jgi:hypothetical protein
MGCNRPKKKAYVDGGARPPRAKKGWAGSKREGEGRPGTFRFLGSEGTLNKEINYETKHLSVYLKRVGKE